MADKQTGIKEAPKSRKGDMLSALGMTGGTANRGAVISKKKKTFTYRVRRGSKVIDGYQTAYSKSDVQHTVEVSKC